MHKPASPRTRWANLSKSTCLLFLGLFAFFAVFLPPVEAAGESAAESGLTAAASAADAQEENTQEETQFTKTADNAPENEQSPEYETATENKASRTEASSSEQASTAPPSPVERPETIVRVVTASRIPQSIEQSPAAVDVIPRDTFRRLRDDDLKSALRSATGAQLSSQGPTSSWSVISLRGARSNQTLLLVDGLPIRPAQGTAEFVPDIPFAAAERIEIVRGPASAVWGSEAGAGVINVITLSPDTAPRWDVAVRGGPSGWNLRALHSGQLDSGTGYVLSANEIQEQGHRRNSDVSSTRLFARFDHDFNVNSTLKVTLSHASSERGDPGSTLFFETPRARLTERLFRWTAQWEGDMARHDNDLHYQVSTYGFHQDRTYRNPDFNEMSRHLNDTMGAELAFNRRQEKTDWHAGVSVRHDRSRSTDLRDPQHERFSTALTGEMVRRLTETMTLVAGARLDMSTVHRPELSPRIGLRVQQNFDDRYRFLVGRSFRYPTFDDLYADYGPNFQGNPNLRPEHGWSAEVGGDHRLGAGQQMSWTVFYRRMFNEIRWVGDLTTDEWRPINIDQSETYGFEWSYERPIGDHSRVTLRYTFAHGRNVLTDERLSWVPPHEVAVVLVGETSRFHWGISGRYRDRITLPSFAIVDGSIGTIVGPGVDVRLQVDNLFDVAYEEEPGYPMPGRTIWLMVRYEL